VTVGVLQIDLSIPGARSLKEKRKVVKSILDRVRARYNVSAAEVDSLDLHQRAGLAFTAVSRDSAYLQGQMGTLLSMIRTHPEARVIDFELEYL